MPSFPYTAIDSGGKTVKASLEAGNRSEALRLLTARGLQPVRIEEPGIATASTKQPSRRTHSLRWRGRDTEPTRRHALPFLEAMSELLSGGLSAGEAVRLLGARLKHPALRTLGRRLWSEVSEGRTLAEAVAAQGRLFDPSLVAVIRAGEATGNLRETIDHVVSHLRERREIRQKLVMAAAYPAFIIFIACLVCLFLLFFLLPRLQSLLQALGGNLPLSTSLLIGGADLLLQYGWIGLLGAGAGWLGLAGWRRTTGGRKVTDGWMLRIPIFGRFLLDAGMLQFSRTLAILLENGINTAEALRLTEQTVENQVLRDGYRQAADRVLEGENLAPALTRLSFVDPLVLDRLEVGENSGNLGRALRDLSDSLQRELSRKLQVFTGVFSTTVLMIAFAFVGFVAFSIVAAVLQLSASFNF